MTHSRQLEQAGPSACSGRGAVTTTSDAQVPAAGTCSIQHSVGHVSRRVLQLPQTFTLFGLVVSRWVVIGGAIGVGVVVLAVMLVVARQLLGWYRRWALQQRLASIKQRQLEAAQQQAGAAFVTGEADIDMRGSIRAPAFASSAVAPSDGLFTTNSWVAPNARRSLDMHAMRKNNWLADQEGAAAPGRQSTAGFVAAPGRQSTAGFLAATGGGRGSMNNTMSGNMADALQGPELGPQPRGRPRRHSAMDLQYNPPAPGQLGPLHNTIDGPRGSMAGGAPPDYPAEAAATGPRRNRRTSELRVVAGQQQPATRRRTMDLVPGNVLPPPGVLLEEA